MKHHARQHRVPTAGKQHGHQVLEGLSQQLWLPVWCGDRDQGLDDFERSSFPGGKSRRGGAVASCVRGRRRRGDVDAYGHMFEGGWGVEQAGVDFGKCNVVVVNDSVPELGGVVL